MRTPIPGIDSSSESDGGVTPFKSPGVKRRRRRKAEMEGSRDQKLKSSKMSRDETGEDLMGFSKYPSPFYPPYPPYHSDKVTGIKYKQNIITIWSYFLSYRTQFPSLPSRLPALLLLPSLHVFSPPSFPSLPPLLDSRSCLQVPQGVISL